MKTAEQASNFIIGGFTIFNNKVSETEWKLFKIKQSAVVENVRLKSQLAELQADVTKLEEWIAEYIGIEKAEPQAGDDPTKEYWIGVDNQNYESLRLAITAAMKGTK